MKINKISATFLVMALCIGAVFAVRTLRPDAQSAMKKRIAERSLGDEKAPLWITEYFDYQCPPCGLARTALEQAVAEHPGQIHLQVRFFPLPAHKNAMKAAIYAECASRQKGKFWKFHDEVFKHQAEWAQDPYAPLKFASYAESAGLELRRLAACANDRRTEKAVAEEKKKAEGLGVKITPTFFFNGKMVIGVNGLIEEIKAFFTPKEASP